MSEQCCNACGCLWDDHRRPEEMTDGIPFAYAASGSGDMSELVTCGDCAECTAIDDAHA